MNVPKKLQCVILNKPVVYKGLLMHFGVLLCTSAAQYCDVQWKYPIR